MKHKKLILFILAAAMALVFAVPAASYADDVPEDAVAKIGDKEYTSLRDAFKDAQNEDIITVLKDCIIATSNPISVNTDITLDLNGKTVTSKVSSYAFNLSESLTVIGTKADSGITLNTDTQRGIFNVNPGANLSIVGTGNEEDLLSGNTAAKYGLIYLADKGDAAEGASISLQDVNASTNYSILTSEDGTTSGTDALIKVSGGEFTCSAETSEGQRAFYLNYAYGDFEDASITCGHGPAVHFRGTYTVVVAGAETAVPSVISGCSLVNHFSGGQLNEAYDRSALFLSKGAQVIIESGSFTGDCGAYVKGGSTALNVENGTFTGTGTYAVETLAEGGGNPIANLSGGTFNGDLQGTYFKVTGGSYTDNPTNFIPEDSQGNPTCDVERYGNYYVVTEYKVAEIDGETYPTLVSAFDAAKDNDEIVLLKDITLSQPVEVSSGKNISLDLNEHEILGSDTNTTLFDVKDAFLDIYGEGTLKTTKAADAATIRVEGKETNGNEDEHYGICVDDDVTIISSAYGVEVSNGNAKGVAYNTGVELNGCTIIAATAAVYVPDTASYTGVANPFLPYIDMNCIAEDGEYGLWGGGTAEYFIDGAELAGTTAAIAASDGCLEIKDGTFSSTGAAAAVFSEKAEAKIAGGFFTAKEKALNIGPDAAATIDGGTFDSKVSVAGSGTGEIIIAGGYYKGSAQPLEIANSNLKIAGGYYSASIKDGYEGKFAQGFGEDASTVTGYPYQVKNTATDVTVEVTKIDKTNNTAEAKLTIGEGAPINVTVSVENAEETPITALDVESLIKTVQAKGGITSTDTQQIRFRLDKEIVDVAEDGKTMTYDVSAIAAVGSRDIEVSDSCLKDNVNFNLDVSPMDVKAGSSVYVTNNGTTKQETVAADTVGIETKKLGTFVISTEDPATPSYTVTFNGNGGTPATQTATVKSGQKVSAKTVTREGYTFDAWYNGTVKFDFNTPITSNLTLTAQWKVQQFTVAFNSNGGSAVASQKVEYGKTATKPADPTKKDNLFDGWYADSALKKAYDFSTPVKGDVTLYAKWLTKGNNADIKATDIAKSAADAEGNALVQNKDYTLKAGGADFAASYTDTFRGTRTVNIVIGDKFYTFTVTGTKLPPIDINTLTVTVSNGVYTGQFVTPKVTITDADGKEIDAKYYDIAIPESSIAVGTYKAKITGKDDYTGTVEKSYKINPPAKAITKVVKGKKAFTVKWKKASATERGGFDKYQVRYSTKKSMKGAKAKTAKKSASKLTVKKLKAKKTYYVQLRTYKTVDGVKYYSKWSAKKKVKTK